MRTVHHTGQRNPENPSDWRPYTTMETTMHAEEYVRFAGLLVASRLVEAVGRNDDEVWVAFHPEYFDFDQHEKTRAAILREAQYFAEVGYPAADALVTLDKLVSYLDDRNGESS